jgi:hypothetical protein
MKFTRWLVFSATLVFTTGATAEPYTRDDVSGLQRECSQARHAKIQPLKNEEIERCVTERGRDRAWCENDLQYFGEASGGRPGMFWDLPACELAFDVERYFQRYPGKDSYSP